jgi:hypothetical protein
VSGFVAQVWATLLDEETYFCSMSTMHRILRVKHAAGERRSQEPLLRLGCLGSRGGS